MKQGKFFKLPETRTDLEQIWRDARVLATAAVMPDWLIAEGLDPADFRHIGAFCYANISEGERGVEPKEWFDEENPPETYFNGTFFGELKALHVSEGFNFFEDEERPGTIHVYAVNPAEARLWRERHPMDCSPKQG